MVKIEHGSSAVYAVSAVQRIELELGFRLTGAPRTISSWLQTFQSRYQQYSSPGKPWVLAEVWDFFPYREDFSGIQNGSQCDPLVSYQKEGGWIGGNSISSTFRQEMKESLKDEEKAIERCMKFGLSGNIQNLLHFLNLVQEVNLHIPPYAIVEALAIAEMKKTETLLRSKQPQFICGKKRNEREKHLSNDPIAHLYQAYQLVEELKRLSNVASGTIANVV